MPGSPNNVPGSTQCKFCPMLEVDHDPATSTMNHAYTPPNSPDSITEAGQKMAQARVDLAKEAELKNQLLDQVRSNMGRTHQLAPGRIQQLPPGPPGPTVTPLMDPVLRLALIDAGILTVEQLNAAEEKIRATTAAFWSPTPASDPADAISRYPALNPDFSLGLTRVDRADPADRTPPKPS